MSDPVQNLLEYFKRLKKLLKKVREDTAYLQDNITPLTDEDRQYAKDMNKVLSDLQETLHYISDQLDKQDA